MFDWRRIFRHKRVDKPEDAAIEMTVAPAWDALVRQADDAGAALDTWLDHPDDVQHLTSRLAAATSTTLPAREGSAASRRILDAVARLLKANGVQRVRDLPEEARVRLLLRISRALDREARRTCDTLLASGPRRLFLRLLGRLRRL